MTFPDTPEDVAMGISTSGDEWEEEMWSIEGPAVDVVKSWNNGETSSESATDTIVQGNLGAHSIYGGIAQPIHRVQTFITAYKDGRLNPESFMIALKGLFFVN